MEFYMKENITGLVKRLNNSVSNEDFIELAYEVTEQLNRSSSAFEAVEPIIKLIESNPEIDFGMPGPLVHFLEKFDKNIYDQKLVESVERRPTKHTLFMLNRIINSLEGDGYLYLFDNVISSPQVSEDIKSMAKEYKEFQVTKAVKPAVHYGDIVLIRAIEDQKEMVKIKRDLGLNLSIKELLDSSKKLPFVLIKHIPFGQGKKMLEKLGSLKDKLEIK